jgi:hypothetical protein
MDYRLSVHVVFRFCRISGSSGKSGASPTAETRNGGMTYPHPLEGEKAMDTFTCAVCHGTFEKGWSDDEAKEELSNTFPGFDTDECDLVCDDCFKKMGFA